MEYSRLSEIYDAIMSYVPYQDWVKMIAKISRHYFPKQKPTLLELGAGTGTMGAILSYEGYHYTGSDLSHQMAIEAWQKGLDFFCADSRAIPINKTFDIVLFLFDGINYLQNIEDYKKTCEEVWRVLNPEGFFFFDITTEYNSIEHFHEYYEAESFDNGAYIRTSSYDREQKLQYNDFDIFLDNSGDGCYKRFSEHHAQKLFSPEEVAAIIPLDLFSVEGIWGDFEQKPYSSSSERIHFLLKRKEV